MAEEGGDPPEDKEEEEEEKEDEEILEDDAAEDGHEAEGENNDAPDDADDPGGEGEAEAPKKKKGKKKKAGPDKMRPFNSEIFDVKFQNNLEEPFSPFFHFTLGSHIKRVDNRDSGGELITTVKPGPTFETDTQIRIPPGDLGEYVKTKKLYWKGTYTDLEEQVFKIRAIHRPAYCTWFGCDTWRGCWRADIWEKEIPLKKIAGGSVQQEYQIDQDVKGVGRVNTGVLQFKILYEEVFDFVLEFIEWQVRDIFAADDGGTSDPYLKLTIQPDWSKPFTNGGLRGRSVRSETEYNTLFAKYAEVGTMYYNGTWAEFQNEILQVQVFDYNLLSTHECIGWANVPFSGQVRDDGSSAQGTMRTGLARTERVQEEVYEGKTDWVKKVIAKGTAHGTVNIEALPKYRQYGAPFKTKSGLNYIGVEIIEAMNLPATDENGLTDAFFMVEWEGMTQKTKVVQKSLNPVFKERLYFPILLFKFNAEEFQKKSPYVKISCFDWDPDGSCDFQGSAEFMIHEISGAESKLETLGVPPITSKFRSKSMKLKKCKNPAAAVSFRAWFEPYPMLDDDGDEIILEPPKEKEKMTLNEEFEERAVVWQDGIKSSAPRAHRKCTALGGYMYKAVDERSKEHFLPCYLGSLQGPLDLQNPQEVFRMVVSVPFEPDSEGGGEEDCWASPEHFLAVKKGDAEDHAIFLTNLFLGLGKDTYIAVGRSRTKLIDEFTDEETIEPGEGDHVWVMTREKTGAITFWETCTGKIYTLEKRWSGEDEDDDDEEEEEDDADEDEGEEDGEAPFEAFFEDVDEVGLLNEAYIRSEEVFMSLDDMAAAGIGDDESSEEEEDLGLPVPEVLPPYWSIHILANHENVWANLQSIKPLNCLYEIDNSMLWKPFCSFEEGFAVPAEDTAPFYKEVSLPARRKKTDCNNIRDELLSQIKEGVKNLREARMYETKILQAEDKDKDKGKLQDALCQGLQLMEDRLCAMDENKRDLVKARLMGWKSKVMKETPDKMKFEGYPINFSLMDTKKIKARIIEKYVDFLTDENQDCMYVFGAYVAPYYCSVNSVWIYVAKLTPLEDDDE